MRKKKNKIRCTGNPPSPWLKKQFEDHNPIATTTEVIEVLKNETAAIGLFKAIAGLSQIASGKDDWQGSKACCEALQVLDAVRLHIKTISEDWNMELKERGSSFR